VGEPGLGNRSDWSNFPALIPQSNSRKVPRTKVGLREGATSRPEASPL
jgi:hypothetical protein